MPRRAHCCEQSTRDADWPNGARETRPPARPCIIHTHASIAESCVHAHAREKERPEVGGLCEPLPLGTLGLRNNRILMRAASRGEDVHRCEKEKNSLYARMTLFSHTNCVETRSRAHAVHVRCFPAISNFTAVFCAVQFYASYKFRQTVKNRRLNTAFIT